MKSEVQNDPLDFQAGMAEVDQKTDLQISGLQVVQALGKMDPVQRRHRLEFDDHSVFHQWVREIVADDLPAPGDRDGVLLEHGQSGAAKFDAQRILINLTRNPAPSPLDTSNAQPMILSVI